MVGKVSVLILGGGFAGRNAAQWLAKKGLSDISVRLVDAKPASEFSPLYPDVVSGRIRPHGVRHSLGAFCAGLGIEFVQATVQGIDLEARAVQTTAGKMQADFLILCLGCETNYHGQQEMRQKAMGLKSVEEALAIRRAAKRHVELLHNRNERFHLVVVGGGYTGIETASQLAYLLRRQTHLSWHRLRQIAEVVVVEKSSRVLEMTSESVAHWAVRHIEDYDIRILAQVSIDRFEDTDSVRLTDGSTLKNALVVWATGVAPGPVCASLNVPKVVHGRLAVDKNLRLPGRGRVFVAGDLAGAIPPGYEEPLRMGVQFSRVGGAVSARNVLATIHNRELETYDPFDPGYVVPLAHGLGVGEVLGKEYHGRLPYDLHYTMSLYRLWTWPNRLAVLKDLLDFPSGHLVRRPCVPDRRPGTRGTETVKQE